MQRWGGLPCTPEDLFIIKAFAARPLDWLDAESIVTRQTTVDKHRILGALAILSELKEDPEILAHARRLLTEKA